MFYVKLFQSVQKILIDQKVMQLMSNLVMSLVWMFLNVLMKPGTDITNGQLMRCLVMPLVKKFQIVIQVITDLRVMQLMTLLV